MNISAVIIGILLFLGGIALVIYIKPISVISILGGIVLVGVGIFMILNSKNEDKIEKIKK